MITGVIHISNLRRGISKNWHTCQGSRKGAPSAGTDRFKQSHYLQKTKSTEIVHENIGIREEQTKIGKGD